MEREALKRKHQNEIAAFHQQQLIQQLKTKSSKLQTLQHVPSSPTVSAPTATAMYPVMYQSMTPAYTGNPGLFVLFKQCPVVSRHKNYILKSLGVSNICCLW
jgi:hypothetical protein